MKWFRTETAEDVVRALDSELGAKLLKELRGLEGNRQIHDYASFFKAETPGLDPAEAMRLGKNQMWGHERTLEPDLRSYVDNMFTSASKLVPNAEREPITRMSGLVQEVRSNYTIINERMNSLIPLTARSVSLQDAHALIARTASDSQTTRLHELAGFGHYTAKTAFQVGFEMPPVVADLQASQKLGQWLDRLRELQTAPRA